ncbi:MAG: hypothetical protein LRZ85_10125 [Alphaproteobacteria bacterium]|nr:hypothetical protein [Alphaproteobacteria bacterium]MCD8519942.1 hypothetical protein [Alphaproteobacteria bacterium]MCD8525701.1 hypothetical protein [Alphaproteobacteria bacterium]MCD8570691.1 hypothetical protein [Alphaproteobacteria bacterium]
MKIQKSYLIAGGIGFAAYFLLKAGIPEPINQFYTDIKDKACVSLGLNCAPEQK